jgi:hypothetical protein
MKITNWTVNGEMSLRRLKLSIYEVVKLREEEFSVLEMLLLNVTPCR